MNAVQGNRQARSVERVPGFAEHPNKLLNPARFARWTPKAAPWVPVSITLGEMVIGASVSLVPLSLAHVDDFLHYSGDVSLWTWWLRKPPIDSDGMRREVELAPAQQRDGQRVPFSIFHHARREHTGSTSLWHIDRVNLSLEIGSTWLATPFHRSGVNRECKELLLAHAFEELKMNRVVLQTDALNVRSRRAIERIGARFEGIAREDSVVWDGRVRSSAIYSLLCSEWKPEF